jgi:hypothetical protein
MKNNVAIRFLITKELIEFFYEILNVGETNHLGLQNV